MGVWAHSPSLRFPTRIKGFQDRWVEGDWSTPPRLGSIRASVALCPGGARHSSPGQADSQLLPSFSDRLAAPVRSMQRSLFSLMLVQSKDFATEAIIIIDIIVVVS